MKKTNINVPVADLKARLSEHLRRVKAGHEVVITDRGTPVARLVPTTDSGDADSLVRDGLARGPVRPLPRDFWERSRVSDPSGRLLEIVLEDRADDR